MSLALASRQRPSAKRTKVDADHETTFAPSAICYRLEPTRRMGKRFLAGLVRTPSSVSTIHRIPPCLLCDQTHTVIDLESVRRVAMMVTPQADGPVVDQAWEAISTIRAILRQQTGPMTVTSQTVFLQRAEYAKTCQTLFRAYFGDSLPATNYIVQPPCGGQALAIEAWAIGGSGVDVQFSGSDGVTVSYDDLRWTHVLGVNSPASASAYSQAKGAFDELARRLDETGASFNDVVRTWLYQGGITEEEHGVERYRELNRARTDFFAEQAAKGNFMPHRDGMAYYPASTGIGMQGRGLTVSCLALQTDREDVRLVPLENPHQTSAYDYARQFSPKSPKFSRAMAVLIGDYVTTWISGTASIVQSESVHLGDAAKQTEQTIDNIQNLICRENFERHGVCGAGARLEDLAKVRVYVKRPEDYETCRAICERRFGRLPILYAQADVCRSNLLVEIEGVAFSRRDAAESSGSFGDLEEIGHG